MFKEAAGIYQIAGVYQIAGIYRNLSFDVQAASVNSFKKTVSKQKLQGVKGAFHFFKKRTRFFQNKKIFEDF